MAKRTKHLTAQDDEKDEIRINKFLSEAGVCSRREADRFIQEGKVKIDGVIAQMGSKVNKSSLVTFFDKPIKKENKLVLIAFHKPEGIVSTTDQREPDNIIDYIKYGMRIYPIGRLDKDSEGLILLTNDGNIVNKILRAENSHEKEYVVTVNKEINAEFIKAMSSGVPILDTVTNPCTVKLIDKFSFNIILTQGLNRQIRRMCEYLGYRVINLRRIRIMNINLGRLKPGDYRNVTEDEIEELIKSFKIIHSHEKTNPEKSIHKKSSNEKFSYEKTSHKKTVDEKTSHKKIGDEKPTHEKIGEEKPSRKKTGHADFSKRKISNEKISNEKMNNRKNIKRTDK